MFFSSFTEEFSKSSAILLKKFSTFHSPTYSNLSRSKFTRQLPGVTITVHAMHIALSSYMLTIIRVSNKRPSGIANVFKLLRSKSASEEQKSTRLQTLFNFHLLPVTSSFPIYYLKTVIGLSTTSIVFLNLKHTVPFIFA